MSGPLRYVVEEQGPVCPPKSKAFWSLMLECGHSATVDARYEPDSYGIPEIVEPDVRVPCPKCRKGEPTEAERLVIVAEQKRLDAAAAAALRARQDAEALAASADRAAKRRHQWGCPTPVDDRLTGSPEAMARTPVIDVYLPHPRQIPVEYWSEKCLFFRLAGDLFLNGEMTARYPLKRRADIPRHMVDRHLRLCFYSDQPDDLHRVAGVAWLLSFWFEFPEGY